MTAHDIVDLLAAKHREDVFVPECKGGPSYKGPMVRMDAWAMKRSWANPLAVVYEVKVSRSDFLADEKWPAYLPLCNEFYFVCPSGLIKPSEVPEVAGLMYVAKSGGRLWRKKKAVYRQLDIPDELYRYILQSRVQIVKPGENSHYSAPPKKEYWRRWLAEKRDKHDIGRAASRAIRASHAKLEAFVNFERVRIERRFAEYADIRAMLLQLGIDPEHGYRTAASAEARLRTAIPDGLARTVKELKQKLEKFQAAIEALTEEKPGIQKAIQGTAALALPWGGSTK